MNDHMQHEDEEFAIFRLHSKVKRAVKQALDHLIKGSPKQLSIRPLNSLLHHLLQLSNAIFDGAAYKHTTIKNRGWSGPVCNYVELQSLAIAPSAVLCKVRFSCKKPYKAVVPSPVNSSSAAHNHCYLHLYRQSIDAGLSAFGG